MLIGRERRGMVSKSGVAKGKMKGKGWEVYVGKRHRSDRRGNYVRVHGRVRRRGTSRRWGRD